MADDPIIESLNPFPERNGETDREARVRKRAHEIWEAAGRPEGREQEHWFTAESEVAELENASFGTTVGPGITIPDIRSADAGELTDEPDPPKTAGAPEPPPDTSKSRVANRDREGPRKAGTSPRPTGKPLV
jgi:hypothetical protein